MRGLGQHLNAPPPSHQHLATAAAAAVRSAALLCCCGVVRVHARARRVLPVRLTHCAEEARRNHAPT